MRRRTRPLPAGIILLGMLFLAVGAYLIFFAQPPGAWGEAAVKPNQKTEEGQSAAAVSDQPTYTYERRELYAYRGEYRIFGVIYIPQEAGDQMPAIIYSHGFGGNHQYGSQYAEAMAARGYVVYCFDFCGGSPSSRSEGSQYEMSIFTEQQDLEAVLSMVQDLDYVDRDHVFLLGTSQGGVVSAMTAADHREEIAGAILLYPAFVLVDDAKARFSGIEEVPQRYRHLFMEVGRAYFEDLFDYDIYGDIAEYDKDVLLIHGDADRIVPSSYSQRAVEAYPSAELKMIRGAGHGFTGKDAQLAVDYMTEYCNTKIR